MLIASSVSKSYGDRSLFSGLSFTLYAGDRLGVVGPNGSGKTTLLNILAGRAEPDGGDIFLRKGVTIGYLEQRMSFDGGEALLAAVIDSETSLEKLDHKRGLIHERLAETDDAGEQATLLGELGEIETRIEHSGAYTREFEAKKVLAGLGFTETDMDRTIGEFSGGWIMRAGLARLLIAEPDILFLDEPTNHLDLDAVIWFENFLSTYPGAVIVISHDRAFLNRTATTIVALENDRARLYHGNYDGYIAASAKEREVIEATIRNQERFIESETRFINRFRAKNTKASQVQSRIKRLEKIERVTERARDKTVNLRIPPSPRSGKTVLTLDRVRFGYGGEPIYDNLDMTLVRGDRVALVGPNGAGKSTLLKLMAGALEPEGGARRLGHNVRSAYYAQHQEEQLTPGNTVLDELRCAAVDETDEQLRTVLGAFLFSGDDVGKRVSMLSGGEQARLALAKLLLHPANLILMDEPTNHLDIPSRDILTAALTSYDGTLCLVTHDRRLIDTVATHVCEVAHGVVTVYHGDYTDYTAKKKRERELEQSYLNSIEEPSDAPDRKKSAREQKRLEAELRNRFYREGKNARERVKAIESEMEILDGRKLKLETALADPSSFGDRAELNDALNEYDDVAKRRDALDEEWLGLSEKLEALRASIFGEAVG
ncbi:MAG: ABC-F family ATP-binding cassette domain-containing protein [Candidatus Latescibacteria bacterium]|nr:ABC-F family ATP-binding cassette domain-containing protein [Candidatus Latescibacterota bacterium]